MISKLRTDTGILVLIAIIFLLLHVATSSPYGFHRDELATLDDARHLEWGFVAYPPLTPAAGRAALALFGISTLGVRLLPIIALSLVVVLSGLMARELGGARRAQVLTALTVAAAPIVTIQTAVLQYVSFDYLWGVLLTYLLVRMLNANDLNANDRGQEAAHWWLPIGAVIGLGMMTKYTMAFFVTGLVAALIVAGLTDKKIRRQVFSPWLWAGAAVSLLIFLPNLIWQIRHSFISLEFLRHIHERDVGQGRTRGFLPEQLFVCVSSVLAPLVFMGLWFYFSRSGRKYRLLGWMFVFTLALFLVAQARSYYLGPLYPTLFAAGSVVWERWVVSRSRPGAIAIQGMTWVLVAGSVILSFALFTPVAPINSGLWNATGKIQDNFKEEIGWTDLVATAANVYNSMPANERGNTGIIVGNYGEAGAINLLGPHYGLPPAISGTNSAWYRSYPESQPQTLIAIGLSDDFLKEHFENCALVAHNTNPYSVSNEESHYHPDIYLCHNLLQAWPAFWQHFQRFG